MEVLVANASPSDERVVKRGVYACWWCLEDDATLERAEGPIPFPLVQGVGWMAYTHEMQIARMVNQFTNTSTKQDPMFHNGKSQELEIFSLSLVLG